MKSLFIFAILFVTNMVQAIEFSAYRIYLDRENRAEQFTIFNESEKDEVCTLKTRHHEYQEDGTVSIWQGLTPPDNSALKLMRFSPKKFTIPAGSRQVVNFSKRRKANIKDGEFQAILSINCKTDSVNSVNRAVNLVANIVHNIPIIVREGKLTGTIDIKSAQVNKQDTSKIDVLFEPNGNRSFYGELTFQNESGEVLTKLPYVSLHMGVKTKVFNIDLPKTLKDEKLWLVFKEYSNFGGNITTKFQYN